ncbi:hypothetical protein [Amycolatopsis tolypomycina]|uniref:hypothetical protein n=1 Tax=Amycolatopsis tolypomycina TaxID=208445 RepID=UPI0033B3F00E
MAKPVRTDVALPAAVTTGPTAEGAAGPGPRIGRIGSCRRGCCRGAGERTPS